MKNSPVISNLVAPDTVEIDPEQTRQILLSVDVDDAEGLDNIDIVQFRSFLPSGNEAQESPFELKDDGEILISGDFKWFIKNGGFEKLNWNDNKMNNNKLLLIR